MSIQNLDKEKPNEDYPKSLEAIYCYDQACVSVFFKGLDTQLPCKIYYEKAWGSDMDYSNGVYERKTGGYYGSDTLSPPILMQPEGDNTIF